MDKESAIEAINNAAIDMFGRNASSALDDNAGCYMGGRSSHWVSSQVVIHAMITAFNEAGDFDEITDADFEQFNKEEEEQEE